MNTPAAPSASDIWAVISKEITGIQLLWEAVNGMYFKADSRPGIEALADDVPTLYRLMQTAMMESLLMRMSRLMDPAQTGRLQNLSLKQLTQTDQNLAPEEGFLRQVWDQSNLKEVRNKYLSHNDLDRSTTQDHTLNIPLTPQDMEAMRSLASGLRTFRRNVHQKLSGAAYLDEPVSLQVSREVDGLNRSLVAGDCFYKLLPDHACLQEALAAMEGGETHVQTKEQPC